MAFVDVVKINNDYKNNQTNEYMLLTLVLIRFCGTVYFLVEIIFNTVSILLS